MYHVNQALCMLFLIVPYNYKNNGESTWNIVHRYICIYIIELSLKAVRLGCAVPIKNMLSNKLLVFLKVANHFIESCLLQHVPSTSCFQKTDYILVLKQRVASSYSLSLLPSYNCRKTLISYNFRISSACWFLRNSKK